MVAIDLNGTVVQVNEFKLKLNPDPWHDVIIPGLDNDDVVGTKITVPPLPGPEQPKLTVRLPPYGLNKHKTP